jgi:predicted CoA-binding protein
VYVLSKSSLECGELSHINVKEILTRYKTVAVVGLSKDPLKASYQVAEYLKKHGFRIVPVNPTADEILGERSYKSLLEIPVEIQKTLEIVDIFRPSADVPPIVEQVVQLRKLYGMPYVVWMQLGIINEHAAELARKAGLAVVMDRCMMQEYRRLFVDR